MGNLVEQLATAVIAEIVQKKASRGKNGNRTAGHNFERECAQKMRTAGFMHTVCSRLESRSRDNEKVDLINKDERVNGRLPYNISCKNLTKQANFSALLKEMPKLDGVTNVIFHKLTKKKAKGTFCQVGQYAILDMEDFLKMVQRIHEFENQQRNDRSY